MSTPSSATRSRSIRHPQNAYTGAELMSSGVGGTMGGGRMSNIGPGSSTSGGYGRMSSRASSAATTTNTTTSSYAKGYSNGNAYERESLADFQDLLQQTNYASNHYESQSSPPSTQPRSKTPDARRVRNSLHKPNPNPSASRAPFGSIQQPMASPSMQSSPPARPSRTNTSNLHDYNQQGNPRERRLSLPSSNQAPDRGFYNDSTPSDFSSSTGPSTPLPPLRSRSGTQSGKNKKGMLSFMSGMLQYLSFRIFVVALIHLLCVCSVRNAKAPRNQHPL
jgi:hypothetical protein